MTPFVNKKLIYVVPIRRTGTARRDASGAAD
jgi:hypothetical protein